LERIAKYSKIDFSDGSPAQRAKADGQKGRGLGGRNFCPPAGFGRRVGVRLPSATAHVRSQHQDFVQNRLGFCPKGTTR